MIYLGRRIPFISILLSYLVGHRGVTYGLLACDRNAHPAAGSSLYHGHQNRHPDGSRMYRLLSLIAGDALTPSGVPLLWPKRKRYTSNSSKPPAG
ncbi:hypothetical protein D0962_37430 [Leptolyngbyaceae cyanobacterium CCMR0082]|uniref:Uncharacterized protein n=1 Tax=Adonisia turfae CCMR0082 TaxID=2304604 RepID=A0A6M0SIS2_9CYAN|nr:hypothetical protein [Adonisia turfae CCMR0082]